MDIKRSHDNGTDIGRIGVHQSGWTTPARGARASGERDLTHDLLTRGAIVASDRLAVACDLTAALAWGVALPSGFGLDADAQACAVATNRGGSRVRSGGVRGRRLELPSGHVTTLDGMPITTPARTWLDCAQFLSWRDVVAMGDQILHLELSDREALDLMVRWGRGRRGVRLAREAVPILDPAAESPGESWVRAHLHRAGLPLPVCNHTVVLKARELRLDMAWPSVLVAVEYDGQEFHGPDRERHDRSRRELLRAWGWEVLVVRREDLANLDDLVATLQGLLLERGFYCK